MSDSVVFGLAVISGVANVVVILTWLKIGPQHILSPSWWRMRQVTVTGGKLLLIVALAVASVGFSAYGFYATHNTARTATIQEQPPEALTSWGFSIPAGSPIPDGVFALTGRQDMPATTKIDMRSLSSCVSKITALTLILTKA